MFKIQSVELIPTQAGNGLKIKDFEIGCAKIAQILTDKELIDEEALVLRSVYGANTEGESPVLYFDTKEIRGANNYVLVKIQGDQVSTITSANEICEIFELRAEDADMLNQYIGALASDRQLTMHNIEDAAGEPLLFFNNAFDMELTNDFRNGDIDTAHNKYLAMMDSPDYRAEYSTDNFIKMFLIAIIKACQDRYNNVFRNESLKQVAEILSNIKYWDDGQLCDSSILDIENYINDIKGAIKIR